MNKGVWGKKDKIIGMAPMNGVTDAVFRYITDKYGSPDVIFTEFVSADGLIYGKKGILKGLIRHDTNTPTIAQLFGVDTDNFYNAAIIALELGFDGIDINMGCPERSINFRGGGAALINTPDIAKKIILKVKQAVKDWSDGQNIDSVKTNIKLLAEIKIMAKKQAFNIKRRVVPVTVKTRIGYSSPTVKDWISNLLGAAPDAISIHGRTFNQKYSGKSDWDAIGLASNLAKSSATAIIGNGDIKSVKEAKEKIKQYSLDGVLIGRAVLGNPWIFSEVEPSRIDRLNVMLEHCEKFIEYFSAGDFHSLRKHLAWYVKGFVGSAKLRNNLMMVNNINDVKKYLEEVKID